MCYLNDYIDPKFVNAKLTDLVNNIRTKLRELEYSLSLVVEYIKFIINNDVFINNAVVYKRLSKDRFVDNCVTRLYRVYDNLKFKYLTYVDLYYVILLELYDILQPASDRLIKIYQIIYNKYYKVNYSFTSFKRVFYILYSKMK